MQKIYMDHGATTPLKEEVLEAMLPYLKNIFGNPSSLHSFGREARKALDESREKVARALGASPEEIIFTSGGTEANNLAIQGVARSLSSGGGGHIITSSIEHHAVLDTVKYLANTGFEVTFLPVDEYGMVDPGELAARITDQTILVSIMTANNEIGTIQPFEEIGRICRERGVYFHTDAVQAIGHLPFNLKEQPIDMLSLSAHKFYGPKGAGALYVRKRSKLKQVIFGGSQERKLRPGTENLPGVVGLGRAIELATSDIEGKSKYLKNLRDRLIKGLLEIEDVRLNGHPQKRLPGNVNVSVLYVEGEALLLSLDLKGIAVSSGSACTSGSLDPSHVLLAIGLDHQAAHGSVRLTLGKDNTPQEVDYTLEAVKEIVERLRKMSSVYKK
ncbi:MAG: cysteine desulfurase NifS [Dethiobacter sp.]|nr:MAG: cysteine desulfurase NifS [Dethiobacter sp.]